MKITQGMFAWNPGTDLVAAGPWPDTTGWSEDYTKVGGAFFGEVRAMTEKEATAYLFIQAMHLIVRDQVHAGDVHEAFMHFDEYRAVLADDMPKGSFLPGFD